MECNVPTDITFSFTGLALRGGKTGPHADGWGLALYEGKFARSFLEPTPACESAMASYIRDNAIKTLLAVAHVRKKTRGKASLENTHPFKRVLWGRHWVFAHNGTLPHVKRHKLRFEQPVGETDSEHAFCWMLERLRESFPAGDPKDPQAALAGDRGARRRARRRREVQFPARRRAPPLRAVWDQALLPHPQGALRARDAARRRDGDRLFGGDDREGPRGRRLDRAAHPRRGLAAGAARIALGVRARRPARDAAERRRRSRSGAPAGAPEADRRSGVTRRLSGRDGLATPSPLWAAYLATFQMVKPAIVWLELAQ